MPRKKKEEAKPEEVKAVVTKKAPDYGTGWNRINNMLQEGYSIEEIKGGK